MGVFGDERAQAIQVGAVLIFAIIIIFLSTYQAFVVPNQNEEIEFNHNQEAQQQMTDLRSNIILMPGSSSTRAASVDLGVRYPSRALFVNPGPASGSLRTVATEDSAFNLTLENIQAVDEEGETGDFWNGTTVTYNTGAIEFRPGYNLYQNAPLTIYEHSVLYNNFTREGVTQAVTEQAIIDGKQITLIAINGSMSESRVGTTSVDFNPISTRARTVSINDTGDPITISLATGMSEDEWQNSTLEDELAKNGGYVQSVDVRPGGPDGFNILDLTLQPNERYQLELAKVGVGTGATETNSAYLTDIDGNDTSVEVDTTQQLTVEVRDKFNVPQSGIKVTGTPEGGSFTGSNNETSGKDGQATFQYEAKDPGTHRINFTIKPGYTPGASHDTAAPRNVTMTVTVPEEQTGGGGGGSGAYNVSWQNPSVGNSAVTETAEDGVYDYDATEASELDLTMETDVPTDGAPVDFSVSDQQKGIVSPVESTTTDSESTTTFDPRKTGELNVYTSSGGSGDVLTLNITDIGIGQLDIDPDQANKASVHNWSFQDVPFEGEVDNITLSYPTGTSFDGLDEDQDVTVVFTRELASGEDKSEINVRATGTDLSGSTAVLELDRQSTRNIVGPSYIEVDGVENPDIGTYDATLTFQGPDDEYSVTKTFTIGEFNVTIDSVTDPVQEGDDVTVDYTIENTGDKQDTQDIVFTVEDDTGSQIFTDTEAGVTLNSGGTSVGSFTYTTQNGDAPEITVDVGSDNDNANRTVNVTEEPTFAVTIDETNSPVTEGEDLNVTTTIENVGSGQDTQIIKLKNFTGAVVDQRSVTLISGETTTFNLTWSTTTGDAGTDDINVTSETDFDTQQVQVTAPSGLTNARITDVVPNASGQMQMVNFTVAGTDLQDGEKVTINLTAPQTAGEIDYGNANVNTFYDGTGGSGGTNRNTNSGSATLNYTSPGITVGTEVSIRLLVSPDNADGPYTVTFERTDTASQSQASFSISPQNGTDELQDVSATDLVGTADQEQTITFTPSTDISTLNGEGEIITIDLSAAQSGAVDYSNAQFKSVTPTPSNTDININSGEARFTYKKNDDITPGTEVEVVLQNVTATSTGGTYQVGFSRGTADTNATTFSVKETYYPTGNQVNEGQLNDFVNMQDNTNAVTEFRKETGGGQPPPFDIDIETSSVPAGDYTLEMDISNVDLQGGSDGITVTATNGSGATLGSTVLTNADGGSTVTIDLGQISSTQTVTVKYQADRKNDKLDISYQRLIKN